MILVSTCVTKWKAPIDLRNSLKLVAHDAYFPAGLLTF